MDKSVLYLETSTCLSQELTDKQAEKDTELNISINSPNPIDSYGILHPIKADTFFKIFYPYPRTFFVVVAFRERGRKRNIEMTEKHRLAASCTYPDSGSYVFGLGVTCTHAQTGDLTCNLGMCSDQESNLQPFSCGPSRPGLRIHILSKVHIEQSTR